MRIKANLTQLECQGRCLLEIGRQPVRLISETTDPQYGQVQATHARSLSRISIGNPSQKHIEVKVQGTWRCTPQYEEDHKKRKNSTQARVEGRKQ